MSDIYVTVTESPVEVIEVLVGDIQGPPGPQGPPGESEGETVALHLMDPTPHPVYDDMPSLVLIYENHLI